MKIVIKFLIVLLLIFSLEAEKFNVALRSSFSRRHKSGLKRRGEQSCTKATFVTLRDFIFGLAHGVAGFDNGENIKEKCSNLGHDLINLGMTLGIKDVVDRTEANNFIKTYLIPKAVDDNYLKLLNKKDRDPKEKKEFEKLDKKVNSDFGNFKCLKEKKKVQTEEYDDDSFMADLIGMIKESVSSVSKLFTGDTGKVTEKIYMEICGLRKIIFKVVKMALEPWNIRGKDLDELHELILEQNKFLGDVVEVLKDIKKGIDEQIDEDAANGDLIAQGAQGVRKALDWLWGKGKDTALDVLKKTGEKLKEYYEKGKKTVIEFVKKNVERFIKSIALPIWNRITKLDLVKNIFGALDSLYDNGTKFFKDFTTKVKADETVKVYKRKIKVFMIKTIKVLKNLIKVLKCMFSGMSLVLKAFKNVLAMILNVIAIVGSFGLGTTLGGALYPVIILMFVDMAIGIICNHEAFGKIFRLLKYVYTNKSAYALGAAGGLVVNTVMNSDFLVLTLLNVLIGNLNSDKEVEIPTLGEYVSGAILIDPKDSTPDKISKAADPFGFFDILNDYIQGDKKNSRYRLKLK